MVVKLFDNLLRFLVLLEGEIFMFFGRFFMIGSLEIFLVVLLSVVELMRLVVMVVWCL